MIHIRSLRVKIDHIDQQLREILTQRFALSREIGRQKAAARLIARDDQRAKEVETRFVTWARTQGCSATFVRELWRLLHEESIRQQTKQKDTIL